MWKRKRHRRKLGGISAKFFLAVPVLLIFILVFLSFKRGLFTARQIEITIQEPKCVSEDQLKNASNILGQNLLFLDPIKITKNLQEKFFCIKSVAVAKHFPDKVKLQVVNRQPLAVFFSLKEKQASVSSLIENMATPSAEQVQNSFIADDEGVIFAKDSDQLNIPKVYIYNLQTSLGGKLNNNQINALKILEKIKTLGIIVSSSVISDDFFIVNAQNLPPRIIFKLSGDINIQLASLQLILAEAKINAEDLEFIDLRFDKPVIKSTPNKK